MPIVLKKRKGSPFWQITGSLRGQRVRESTGTDNRQEAEKYRLKVEQGILEGRSDRKTVAHAVIEYIQNNGENRFLDRITLTLGQVYLDDITQELIDIAAREAYPGYKRSSGGKTYQHKKSTIRRQFYVPLAAVLHYAAEMKWMPYMRVKMTKAERPAPQWAELSWFQKLWPECDVQLRALTTFLPFTGCRIQECLNLKWDDLDLKEGWAYIRYTKNKEHRTVYLQKMVIDELKKVAKDWKAENMKTHPRQGYVFVFRDRDEVRRRLKAACRAAQIPYLSSHKIGSHTYATLLRRYAGMDARGLQATGRWKDIKSTYHYTHVTVAEEAKRVDVFAQKLTQKRLKA